MTQSELLERVRSILVQEFELERDSIAEESRLVEDLDLDSIDGVTIVVRLETLLHVTITDEEIQNMATVGDIVSALADRLGAAASVKNRDALASAGPDILASAGPDKDQCH